MSDNKYTAKEREFIRLHQLQHDFARVERAVIEWAGERCPDYEATCVVCKTWKALDVLKEELLFEQLRWHQEEVNEAIDFVINKKLSGDADTDKAYANMTPQEIFQDLIAPTTEDNDDE